MKRSSTPSSPTPTAATPIPSTDAAPLPLDDAAPTGAVTTAASPAAAAAVETVPPAQVTVPVQAAHHASAPKPRVMHFRSQLTAPITLRPSLARHSQLPSWAAPFFASVPALLLGAFIVAGASSPLPQPITEPPLVAQRPSDTDLLRVPLSRTLLVRSEASGGSVVLRGRVQPQASLIGLAGDGSEGPGLSSGRAEVNGTVSNVWVKPGDFVQAGQMVVQISTGSAVRPAPRSEAAQSKAEAAQVAASQQQDALDQRLEDAQTRLLAAQERVKQAQLKVDQAHDIVRRLRSQGASDPAPIDTATPNALTPASTPAPATGSPAPVASPRDPITPPRPAVTSPDRGQQDTTQRDATQRERETLLRDIRRYTEDAEAAEKNAKAAQDDATKAETQARTNKDRIPDLQAKVQAVQKAFDAGGAKGSEVEAARAAVEDAQTDANEAATRALVSRQEAEQLRARAQLLRSRAQDAQNKAAATLRKLQTFSDEPQRPATALGAATKSSPAASRRRRKKRQRVLPALPAPLPAPLPPLPAPLAPAPASDAPLPRGMTVQEAAKLVRSAVAESEAALADSHRIEREVADYKRRVSSTTQNLETSSKDLRDAQNRVLSTGVRTVMTTVHARAAGIVQSVVGRAQNVGPDDVVFTIKPLTPRSDTRRGQTPRVLEARIAAPDGIWRTLRPQQTLPALLVAPSTNAPAAASSGVVRPSTHPGHPAAHHPDLQGRPLKPAPHQGSTPQSGTPQSSASHGVAPHGVATHNAAPRSATVGEQLPPHRVSPSGLGGRAGAQALSSQAPASPVPVAPRTGSFALARSRAVTSPSSPGISVTLSVRDVAPPTTPGAPAIVRAAVNYQAPEGSANSKLLSAGAGVLCSVPKPGGRSAMRVPVSAIWRDASGTTKIAVLRTLPAPLQPDRIAPQGSPLPPAASPDAAPPTTEAPPVAKQGERTSAGQPLNGNADAGKTDNGKVALVEWHTVVTGASDGVLQEIVSGLQQGERIVLDPQTLMVAPQTEPIPAQGAAPGITSGDGSAPNGEANLPPEGAVGGEPAPAAIGDSSEGTRDAAPSQPAKSQGMQPTPAKRVLLVLL